MYDDLYPEAAQTALDAKAARPPEPKQTPRFSLWGTTAAVPKGVAAGAAQAAGSTADVLGAFGSVLGTEGSAGGMFSLPTPEEEKQQREATEKLRANGPDYMSEGGRSFRNVAKDYTPDPLTTHASERMVFDFARVASKAITAAATMGGIPGAVVAGAEEGFTVSDQLAQEGVDLGTRSAVGGVTAVTNALSFGLPIAGGTAAKTVGLALTGGPLSFMAQNAATRKILQDADYSKLADQYDPFDPLGLALSTVIPLGFGAMAMRGAAKRTAGQKIRESDATETVASDGAPDVREITVYHGTETSFDNFESGMFTSNRSRAENYAMGGAKRVIEARLDIQNPMPWADAFGKTPEEIKAAGFDGTVQWGANGEVVRAVVVDPAQVKKVSSPETVDAARTSLLRESVDNTNPLPKDLSAAQPHADAHAKAIDQMASGERVNVADVLPENVAVKATEDMAARIEEFTTAARDSGLMPAARGEVALLDFPPLSSADSLPPGTWVQLPYPDMRGRPVAQIREVGVNDLYLPELDASGKLQPEKRSYLDPYTQRALDGEKPPAITVVEMEDGRLRVVDGHRRVMAARAAGASDIRAVVSPLIETADGKVPLTFEIAPPGTFAPRSGSLTDPLPAKPIAGAKEAAPKVDAVTNQNDVVGNQGGRSADDILPGALAPVDRVKKAARDVYDTFKKRTGADGDAARFEVEDNSTPVPFRAGAAEQELENLGWDIGDRMAAYASNDASHYITARKLVASDAEYGDEYVTAKIRISNHGNTTKAHDHPDVNIAPGEDIVWDIEEKLNQKITDEGYELPVSAPSDARLGYSIATEQAQRGKPSDGNSGLFDPRSGSLTDPLPAKPIAGAKEAAPKQAGAPDYAQNIDLIEAQRIRAVADKMRAKNPGVAAKYDDMALAHELKAERDTRMAEGRGEKASYHEKEATRLALENPDVMVMVEGMDAPKPLSEVMAMIKKDLADDIEDSNLIQVAAECFISTGAGGM